MAKLLWSPGAFAQRYPRLAADIGRANSREAAINGELYETAGVMNDYAVFHDTAEQYREPGQDSDCCSCAGAAVQGTACQLGMCAGCDDVDGEFEGAYPGTEAALDESHALAAAIRDIQADPDVDDVPAALAQAHGLAAKAELSTYYVPASPAKKLPDGSDAPPRCPVCGAMECPACGCPCECVDSTADQVKAANAVADDVIASET